MALGLVENEVGTPVEIQNDNYSFLKYSVLNKKKKLYLLVSSTRVRPRFYLSFNKRIIHEKAYCGCSCAIDI
jgi:hypothetical protein